MSSGICLSPTFNSAFHCVDFLLRWSLPIEPPVGASFYLNIFADPVEKYIPFLLFQQKLQASVSSAGLGHMSIPETNCHVPNPEARAKGNRSTPPNLQGQKVGKVEFQRRIKVLLAWEGEWRMEMWKRGVYHKHLLFSRRRVIHTYNPISIH